MGQEEHEGLSDFRRHFDLLTRHDIAVEFVAFEARHTGVQLVDEDPEDYIRWNR